MVNIVSCILSFMHMLMRNLAGMEPKQVEIEPGTVLNFWVPSSKPTTKSKPPLLLIHGFAADGILTWHLQILLLSYSYSLYVPDLLFFGGSHTDKPDRSARFQADCLAKALKKLLRENENESSNYKRCMVVGFSYGGLVAFRMAEHHPDVVAGVVVSGSPVDLAASLVSKETLAGIGGLVWGWTEMLLPTRVEGVKHLLHIAVSLNMSWLPSIFYKHYLEIMFTNRKERLELLEAIVVRDEDVPNHQFQQTIHLIWGDEDRICSTKVAHNLKSKLGGRTRLQTIEKAGHAAVMERPLAFNKCLKEMLASLVAEEQLTKKY